jgi:single-strand DNA-binding protein
MINRAILQGRLVADPDLKHTQSGVAVVSFRIACDRDYRSKDPNAQNCDFINVVAWRSVAEFISRWFVKGSLILVDGRIQVRDYTDNNGNKRNVVEVVAESVNFCGKRESNARGNGTPGGRPQESYSQQNYQQEPQEFQEMEDDDGPLPWE